MRDSARKASHPLTGAVHPERVVVDRTPRLQMVPPRIPAGRPVSRSALRTKWNRALLAETYILVGDLYFVIDAPCAFVRWPIPPAFSLCPRRRSVIREVAEVVSMMEPCKQSKPCDALLRRMAHKTASARSILDEFSREGPFAYISDDPNWEACDSPCAVANGVGDSPY